jgi:DNA-binding transcriptional MerR regulator
VIIGELSARTGVSTRSLRYYEQQGLVASRRSPNGYRHYDDDAIAVVRTIRSMYDLGFSSEMVRTVLPCATGQHDGVDRQTVRHSVEAMRDDIIERIDQLTRTRDTLTQFLQDNDQH